MTESIGRVYGDQAAVFPVNTEAGKVWMTGRDDLSWQGAYVVWCEASSAPKPVTSYDLDQVSGKHRSVGCNAARPSCSEV